MHNGFVGFGVIIIVGLLQPACTIICSTSGQTLEPVRKGHFSATFNSPDGSSGTDDNYLLRSVSGLDQNISPGQWALVNYPVSYPKELSPAEVTLKYIMLTDEGGRKRVLDFWWKWKAKVYDVDRDLPALFNQCVGSGEVTALLPDGDKKFVRYLLSGCWPRSVILGDLDRDSSDPLDLTVTLVVTKVAVA